MSLKVWRYILVNVYMKAEQPPETHATQISTSMARITRCHTNNRVRLAEPDILVRVKEELAEPAPGRDLCYQAQGKPRGRPVVPTALGSPPHVIIC